MGILDRVAGAVGVKRRHDGESVSKPLKFANLEDTGTTNGGKVVRQASSNPNCDLPQQTSVVSDLIACIEKRADGSKRGFFSNAGTGAQGNARKTCAGIACETGRDIYSARDLNGVLTNDTRCLVANPLNLNAPGESWTKRINPIHWMQYSNLTGATATPNVYLLNGQNYIVPPQDVYYPVVHPHWASQHEVDPSACIAGQTDAIVARQIQCDLNLRADCNTASPSPSPSGSPSPSNIDLSTVGIAAGLSTLATGAISTVAAYLTPTPTAVLAAAPSGVITQIALGVGIFGGGAVAAGAGYGAYRFAQWLRSHPFQNTGGSIEDAIAFAKLAEEEAQQDAVSVAGEFEDSQATPEPASFTELRRAIAAGEITADDIQRVLGSIDLGQLREQLPPPAYEEVVSFQTT